VSARDEILKALRAAAPQTVPLPDIGRVSAVRYPDVRERFAKSVVEVGGRCVLVEGPLEAALAAIPEYAAARKVVSLVPGVAKANVDLSSIGDPHDLRDVDFCVLPAELGVAENGAVWITEHGGINRADNLFLAFNVVTGGAPSGRVAFDEFHQGYGATENSVFAYFRGTPILWMFAQGALVVLALVWTRGRRFARPLPAPRADRRSKLEFVASMAELQQRARAYDLAIENIYTRTRRALARYGGVPASATLDVLAARVAARSGRDRQELESLMRECEDAIAGTPLSARRALELARRLRELERDLGILMRSREIRQAR